MNGLTSNEEVNNFCQELYAQNSSSIHFRNFFIDCLIEKIEKKENIKENVQLAHEVFFVYMYFKFFLKFLDFKFVRGIRPD